MSEFADVAKKATRQSAIDAVRAGNVVTGLKDGRIVQYGPGHLPLPSLEEDAGDAKQVNEPEES